jgi:D-sedoheptulose 7-phosphate isomerase
MQNKLTRFIELSAKIKDDQVFLTSVDKATETIIKSIENKGQLLVCGNGGSATQASHMVGEFVGRFGFDRPPLPAISLFDLASTTAIGNDYGYKEVFSRFVIGLGKENDVLFSLSTSGNSENCLEAMQVAKKIGMKNIALLGKDGGRMKDLADVAIVIPDDKTPEIQELHLMVIHHICENVEAHFFKKP